MSFGPLAPGASIGGQFKQLCTLTPYTPAADSYGQGSAGAAGTAVANIPCTLQQMSATRSMAYKANSPEGMYDLYAPLRREGQATNLAFRIDDRVAVEGVNYKVVGAGVRQGTGGTQRVALEVLGVG